MHLEEIQTILSARALVEWNLGPLLDLEQTRSDCPVWLPDKWASPAEIRCPILALAPKEVGLQASIQTCRRTSAGSRPKTWPPPTPSASRILVILSVWRRLLRQPPATIPLDS